MSPPELLGTDPRRVPPISREALALHRETLVIDLHADTPDLLRHGYDFHRRHRPWLPQAALVGHVDGPRMREAGQTAQVFGLFVMPWQPPRRRFPRILAQLEAVHAAVARDPQGLRLVHTAAEVEHAARDGVPAGLLCLEGAHPLQGDLDRLDLLRARGLRALGLLHFAACEAGAPALGWGRRDAEGLRPFGRQLVEACNARGVILDLAHVNRRGFLEAVGLSRAPVMVSHTGVSAIHATPRNIDDEQIRAVAKSGGCVGVIYSRKWLGGPDLDALLRHLEHVIRVGGEGCAALGSDFDGYVVPPRGLHDVTAVPRITEALLQRGHAPERIRKILGGNALRLLRDVPAQGT